MGQINEMDRVMLEIYKFAMPIIAVIFTCILGMIANWIRNMAKDMGCIKEEIIKHGMINEQHGKEIRNLDERVSDNHESINNLKIQMAKINKN